MRRTGEMRQVAVGAGNATVALIDRTGTGCEQRDWRDAAQGTTRKTKIIENNKKLSAILYAFSSNLKLPALPFGALDVLTQIACNNNLLRFRRLLTEHQQDFFD
jgi:hypothetical protein